MNKFKISENIYSIGLRDNDDLITIKEILMINKLLFMNQVHSSDILDARIKGNYELLVSSNAFVDGIIVNRKELKNFGLVVKTADCVPIFIFDEELCIGIHAGWKGLANGIQFRLLDFFSKSKLSNFKVIIGPHAINGYEVKNDVLEKFKAPVYLKKNGKFFLDMQQTLCNDLCKIGFNAENIKKTDLCTIGNPKLYSYRRNNLEEKRNFNIFLLK